MTLEQLMDHVTNWAKPIDDFKSSLGLINETSLVSSMSAMAVTQQPDLHLPQNCYVGLRQSRTLTITQRSRDDEDSRSQGHKRFMRRTKDGSSIISTKSVKNESLTSTLYILRVLQGRSLIEQGFVS